MLLMRACPWNWEQVLFRAFWPVGFMMKCVSSNRGRHRGWKYEGSREAERELQGCDVSSTGLQWGTKKTWKKRVNWGVSRLSERRKTCVFRGWTKRCDEQPEWLMLMDVDYRGGYMNLHFVVSLLFLPQQCQRPTPLSLNTLFQV